MTKEPPSDGPIRPRNAIANPTAHAPEAVATLRQAMRRARFDDAERVGVQAESRATQIGRLELLQEALGPLLAQIPRDVDLFDIGLMPGVTPRLFIDMIGFVEMGRDSRVYRLLQDTRHTRVTIAESSDIPTIVQAVTDYVARRLLERDKALAADSAELRRDGELLETAPLAATTSAGAPPTPARKRSRFLSWSGMAFAFVIDLLGAIAFFLILAVAGWFLWNHLHGQV